MWYRQRRIRKGDVVRVESCGWNEDNKMAKWFRSEPMEYISIIMNEDAAHDCLQDLGKLGAIQFTDVSTYCLFHNGRAMAFVV